MGGREVGGMANLLSAHRDLANPAHRAEVAALWGVPSVPAQARQDRGRDVRGRAPTARSRRSGSPARTRRSRCPTRPRCAARSQRAEFVVVQEAFATTATCDYADLLLPATTWGEKEGTVTNSERRIAACAPAIAGAGRRRAHDWAIAVDFARRLEARARAHRHAATLFPYARRRSDLERAPRDRRAAATSTSPACSYAMLEAAARSNGRCAEGEAHRPRAALRRRRVPDAGRPRPLRRHVRTSRWPRPAMRAIPSRSTPAGCATSGTA